MIRRGTSSACHVGICLINSESQQSGRAKCLARSSTKPLMRILLATARLGVLNAYQVKVVTAGLLEMPQPLEQALESTHAPARPQSVAAMTVVGQNPQIPCEVSIRQSNPESAVLGLLGSPFRKPHVDSSVVILLSKTSVCFANAASTVIVAYLASPSAWLVFIRASTVIERKRIIEAW